MSILMSEAIAQARKVLRDPVVVSPPANRPYADDEITGHMDTLIVSMFRKLVEQDDQYHNFPLALKKGNAREVSKGVFQWPLQTWVDNVVEVRERLFSTDVQEQTFSPYMWAFANQTELGRRYGRHSTVEPSGWSWEGFHTLRLHNQPLVPDLTVLVAKTPPKMWQAKIGTPSGNPSIAFLPPSLLLGAHDREIGAIINAEVQCVSTQEGASRNLGVVRRVVHSDASAFIGDTARQHALYFETPFPDVLVNGDVIETLLPIPKKHVRYLILKVVAACAQKNNTEILKAIGPELGYEAAEYERFATPRDPNAGTHWRSDDTGSSPPPFNPNYDNSAYANF